MQTLAPTREENVESKNTKLFLFCNWAIGVSSQSMRTDPNGMRLFENFQDSIINDRNWIDAIQSDRDDALAYR